MTKRTMLSLMLILAVAGGCLRSGCGTHRHRFADTKGTKATGNYLNALVFPGQISSNVVTTDNQRNVIIAGQFNDTIDLGGGPLQSVGDSDVFIAKFDSSGRHLWSHRFGGKVRDEATGIAIDSQDRIVVTGLFLGTINFGQGPMTSLGGRDLFVAKFDRDGTPLWSIRNGGAGDEYTDNGATIDPDDNIITTGLMGASASFGGEALPVRGDEDIFVAKFESDGTPSWAKSFGGVGHDYGASVATDRDRNIIIVGNFSKAVDFGGGTMQSAGVSDIFVLKLDRKGNYVWSRRFGDSLADEAQSVIVDEDGNLIMAGKFQSYSIDLGDGPLKKGGVFDVFMAKYDPKGNHLWSRSFPGDGLNHVGGVALGGGGQLVLVGSFVGKVGFGGDQLTTQDNYDGYIAKFDQQATHLWSKRLGGNGSDGASGVAVDRENHVLITGHHANLADFGAGSQEKAGSFLLFLSP